MNRYKNIRCEKGSILLGIIIFSLLISSLGLAMVSYYLTASGTVYETYDAMRAYYLAEGGGRYAQAKMVIGAATDKTYTLLDPALNPNDSFRILTVAYTDASNYTYSSRSNIINGARRIKFYEQTGGGGLGPQICSAASGYVGNGGSVKHDEGCDGTTGNDGWRSNRSDSDANNNISYYGFNFGAGNEKQIMNMELWHDDNRYSVSSVLPQYSDNGSSWTAAGGQVSVGNYTSFSFANFGEHRYWRILAKTDTPDGNDDEWYVNELEMREGTAAALRIY